MPDDNGDAVPSSNNMGYQVISRVDDTHIVIAVSPNSDMIQRIKSDVSELQENVVISDDLLEPTGEVGSGDADTIGGKYTAEDIEAMMARIERLESGKTGSYMPLVSYTETIQGEVTVNEAETIQEVTNNE